MADGVTEHIRILLEAKTEAADRAMRKSAREILALEKSYDPVSRATIRFKEVEERLARAVENGTLSVERQKTLLTAAKAQYDATATGVQRLTTAQTAMGSTTGNVTGFFQRNGNAVLQAGYQIGDFAIQVGAGQNAMVAFSQQGSQMLGVFGVFGAVAGAALAIAAPFVTHLFKTADGAKAAEEQMKALNSALGEFESAQAAAGASMADLTKRYGTEYAEQARNLLELKEKLAALDLQKELDGLADMMGKDAFGDFGERTAAEFRASAADLEALHVGMELLKADAEAAAGELERAEIARKFADIANAFNHLGGADLTPLMDQLNLGAGDAARLAAAMIDLRAADGAQAQAAAMAHLRETMVETLGSQTRMTEEARVLYDQLVNGETAALRLAAAGALIAQFLGDASANAGSLVSNLESALLAQNKFDSTSLAYSSRFRGEEEVMSQSLAPVKLPAGIKPKTTRGGGGGRSRSDRDPLETGTREIEQMQRRIDLLGQTTAQAATLTAKWKMLDEVKRAGLDLDARSVATGQTLREAIDAQAASVGALAEEYEQAKDSAAFFEKMQSSLKDGFLDAIAAGEGFGDTLDMIGKMMKRAAAEAIFFNSGPFAGGGGGGGLLGGVFDWIGGLFGKRAGGGPVQAGSPYLVNENTPNSEIFVPSRSGAILNVPQAQAALAGGGGSGGPMAITVNVDGANGDQHVIDLVATGVEAGLRSYDRNLPGRMRSITADPRVG